MGEPEKKERIYLDHMVWCSGYFTMRTKDGKVYEVQAQKHHLREFFQEWNAETEEWEDFGDEVDLDEFYLTGNESGFRFDYEDVEKYFGEVYDYNWNGLSNDWCGIDSVTPEPVEISQKKWENYKSRFPKITSKEQFNWERSELRHFIPVYSNKSLRSIIQRLNLIEKDIKSLDIEFNYRNFITYEADVYNVGLDFKGYKYEVHGIHEEEYGDIEVNYSYNNLDEFLNEISNHEISSVQGHIKNHDYISVIGDWVFIKANWLQETPESIKEEFRQEYSKDNYKDLEWEGERDYRDGSNFWRKNNNIRSILISIVHGDTTYQIDWRNTLENAISKEALKLLTTDQINRNASDTWYEMDKEEFRAHLRKLKQE